MRLLLGKASARGQLAKQAWGCGCAEGEVVLQAAIQDKQDAVCSGRGTSEGHREFGPVVAALLNHSRLQLDQW